MAPRKRRKSKAEIRRRRESFTFYLGVGLFVGNWVARSAGIIPLTTTTFDLIGLVVTAALIIVPLFGRDFFIDLVKAVRGGASEDGKDGGDSL